jgi:hypothetical protein
LRNGCLSSRRQQQKVFEYEFHACGRLLLFWCGGRDCSLERCSSLPAFFLFFCSLVFRAQPLLRRLWAFPLKPSLTGILHNPLAGSGELMFTRYRSSAGPIKSLFKLAQCLRAALVRAILDRSPAGPAEPVSTAKTHRLMLAADRASARIAKWEKRPEPDPRPIAFWPADFVEGDQ